MTLQDIKTIKKSFFETIKRSYHPRIKYPDQKRSKEKVISSEANADDVEPKSDNDDETKNSQSPLEQTEISPSETEENSMNQDTMKINIGRGR